MAMHQTDELNDVLCVLLEQFDFLGINPVLTHLTLMDEANETFTLRITSSPKERVFAEQKIDINAVESWKTSFENWKKGEPNTVDCIDYPPEVLPAVGGSTNISSEVYPYNEDVTLEAIPAEGYDFVNWTENGIIRATTRFYIFNATANRHLVANFVLQQVQNFTVTSSALPVAGGTTNIPSGSYPSGQSVTLIATSNTGYNFVNWTENGTPVSTSASYTFTVTANRTLIANFELQKVTVTLSSNPTSGGFTNFASTSYNYGQNLTINANANANYTFVNWTENGEVVSDQQSFTFIATEDRNIVANFELLNGIGTQELANVKVFPNPANEYLIVSGVNEGDIIKMTTLTGAVVKQITVKNSSERINLNLQRKGNYIILIENKDGLYSTLVVCH